jgi:hypothetical protein
MGALPYAVLFVIDAPQLHLGFFRREITKHRNVLVLLCTPPQVLVLRSFPHDFKVPEA